MEGEVLLKLSGVRRSYLSGGEEVEVLHGIDLEVRQGEMLAIVGPSGSGRRKRAGAGRIRGGEKGQTR